MLGPFEVIGNKRVFIELQLLQSMKIHNFFHSNLLQKAFIDLLTNKLNELCLLLLLTTKKSGKLKIF